MPIKITNQELTVKSWSCRAAHAVLFCGDMSANHADLKEWSHEEHNADRTALSFSVIERYGRRTPDVESDGDGFTYEDENPGLFKATYDGTSDEPTTDAMLLGTTTHLAVYEPEKLATYVRERPMKTNDDGKEFLMRSNSKDYKEWEAKQRADGAKHLIKPVDFAAAVDMAMAAKRSKALEKFHRFDVLWAEKTIIWMDEKSGLLLKIRPDRLLDAGDYLIV